MSLLDEVAGLLTDRGIDIAVIGAAALAAHGVSRATADLDLLVVDLAVLDDELWSDFRAAGDEVRRGDEADSLAGVVRAACEKRFQGVVGLPGGHDGVEPGSRGRPRLTITLPEKASLDARWREPWSSSSTALWTQGGRMNARDEVPSAACLQGIYRNVERMADTWEAVAWIRRP
ncbi:MAG: hypothetical protein JRS35_08320 [Deltaproteobacteria bacterium]|nr:hypothetical protein [Deltaproteobacteria bacterium]